MLRKNQNVTSILKILFTVSNLIASSQQNSFQGTSTDILNFTQNSTTDEENISRTGIVGIVMCSVAFVAASAVVATCVIDYNDRPKSKTANLTPDKLKEAEQELKEMNTEINAAEGNISGADDNKLTNDQDNIFEIPRSSEENEAETSFSKTNEVGGLKDVEGETSHSTINEAVADEYEADTREYSSSLSETNGPAAFFKQAKQQPTTNNSIQEKINPAKKV